MRLLPDDLSPVLATIGTGRAVTLLGEMDGWIKIEAEKYWQFPRQALETTHGWAPKQFINSQGQTEESIKLIGTGDVYFQTPSLSIARTG